MAAAGTAAPRLQPVAAAPKEGAAGQQQLYNLRGRKKGYTPEYASLAMYRGRACDVISYEITRWRATRDSTSTSYGAYIFA